MGPYFVLDHNLKPKPKNIQLYNCPTCGPGYNIRFEHTFIDEDQMKWCKRPLAVYIPEE